MNDWAGLPCVVTITKGEMENPPKLVDVLREKVSRAEYGLILSLWSSADAMQVLYQAEPAPWEHLVEELKDYHLEWDIVRQLL